MSTVTFRDSAYDGRQNLDRGRSLQRYVCQRPAVAEVDALKKSHIHRAQHCVLVWKTAIDDPDRHTGFLGDCAQARCIRAAFTEDIFGGVQQPVGR